MADVLNPNRHVLHSWKEIAAYTGRGVRTIQRYEVHFGFPIHRPAGSPRSAVLAFSDEIDRWLASSPTRLEPHSTGDNGHFSHDATALHLEGLCSKATLGKNRAEAMLKRVEQTRELLVKLTESVRRSRALRTEWQQRA